LRYKIRFDFFVYNFIQKMIHKEDVWVLLIRISVGAHILVPSL
jgi:hypothetical protein